MSNISSGVMQMNGTLVLIAITGSSFIEFTNNIEWIWSTSSDCSLYDLMVVV